MIRFLQTEGPVKKVVLSGLLLLICGAMVIAFVPGIGSDTGAPGKGIIAKVNGEEITPEQVRQTAREMAQQQAQQYGAQASMIMSFLIQQDTPRAADQLIDKQALLAEAQKMGLKATPQEVKDELQHGRYAGIFFPGGNFIGQAEYEGMLQQHNLTPAMFEDSVGNDIVIGKLQTLITSGASVSDAAIREAFVKQNTKVKFDYAVLKEDDIKKGLHPTVEELKAFYNTHLKTYTNSIPEKRKIKYVMLDTAKVQAEVRVTNDELQAYYNQHRDQYRVAEQAKVSHILIKTPLPGPDGKVDEKGVADAQKRAEDLLKQLKAGANFEELAKKYSEDPGSAKEGGSLGWIGRGRTVPEFEKVAFSLPKGQISGLLLRHRLRLLLLYDRLDFGLHLIECLHVRLLPIVHPNNVEAVAALHQAADLALR